MNMIDCLEAYGMVMGSRKCRDLIDDFQECAGQKKQMKRFEVADIFKHLYRYKFYIL